MLRLSLIVGCLVASLLSATTTSAQVITPDFPSLVQPTLPANQLLVGQITDALSRTDLGTVSDLTGSTVSVDENLVQQLTTALNNAPDDASRSRIQGVLTHLQAALDSLRQAQTADSLDLARARLDQARGEAQEALTELQPFVVGMATTGAISVK
jgi:hypothetical protein